MGRWGRTVGAVSLLALLTACGSNGAEPAGGSSPMPSALDTSPATPAPEPQPDDGVRIDIALEDGSITPTGDRVEVEAGEPVTLHVDSDTNDEIHVHSDPEHEFEVGPGPDQSFTFTVDVPGRVDVESHATDRTIVQLLVR